MDDDSSIDMLLGYKLSYDDEGGASGSSIFAHLWTKIFIRKV